MCIRDRPDQLDGRRRDPPPRALQDPPPQSGGRHAAHRGHRGGQARRGRASPRRDRAGSAQSGRRAVGDGRRRGRAAGGAMTALGIHPIAGAPGAEISGVDLSRDPGEETVGAIRRAWLEHLVIFFRDQRLSAAQFLAFGRRFGEPIEYPFVRGLPDTPEVIPVLKQEHEQHNFGGIWHSDTSYLEHLSLIHISEPTRLLSISYAVFCLKKKKKHKPLTLTHNTHSYAQL